MQTWEVVVVFPPTTTVVRVELELGLEARVGVEPGLQGPQLTVPQAPELLEGGVLEVEAGPESRSGC